MTDESYLTARDGKVTGYIGPDGTSAFRAIAIGHALKLYGKSGMKVNRAYTPTAMLKAAAEITGKTYKRGQYNQAGDDLLQWANEMKAALPVIEGESR